MFFLIPFLTRQFKKWRGIDVQKTDTQVADASKAKATVGRSNSLMLLFHEARYDLLISMRNTRARFFTFVFPILLLVVFDSVFAGGHTKTAVAGHQVALTVFFVPGIMAMSVMTAAYAGQVIQIVTLRQSGVLKRRRASPVPPWVIVGGQALAAVATTFMMQIVLLVLGSLLYSVSFSAGAIATIAITVFIGTIALVCISFALAGLINNADAAQPVVQLTMLPLYFISGIFVPGVKGTVHTIAEIFPLEHIADEMHRASVSTSFGNAINAGDLLVLAAWIAGAIAFSAWKFSWLPTRA
jgi:ABC-2 type transport system permease protein